MDTVDLVLTLLAALTVSTISLAVLAYRLHRHIVRLVAQQQRQTRWYDTGLNELLSTSPPDPQAAQ